MAGWVGGWVGWLGGLVGGWMGLDATGFFSVYRQSETIVY